MVNMANGIARGCDLSRTTTTMTTAWRKHGDLSHTGLLKIRVHIIMTLDIHVN